MRVALDFRLGGVQLYPAAIIYINYIDSSLMRPTINIVVTCTKRKRFSAKRELQLRTVGGKTVSEKNQMWLRRLRSSSGDRVLASELYAGDHWSVVRSLGETAAVSGFTAKIWICSAGYGLIPLNANVHPYAATFSPRLRDSITHGMPEASVDESARQWWRLLAKWAGPKVGCPRSIESLARRHPKSPLLIVASPSYLAAIEDDIELAAKLLNDSRSLLIFSGNPRKSSQIMRHCLPCSAVLQRVVGGARTSLNVRLARRMLERLAPGKLDHGRAKRELQRLIDRQPKMGGLRRQRTSDASIQEFILRGLKKDQDATFGSLLRQFRDRGNACEYSRFRALFRGIQRENLHGR
jgi:hypothetical protein